MVQPTRTGGRPSIDPMHEFGPRNQMIASMGMKAAARGLIERQRDRRSRSPGRWKLRFWRRPHASLPNQCSLSSSHPRTVWTLPRI